MIAKRETAFDRRWITGAMFLVLLPIVLVTLLPHRVSGQANREGVTYVCPPCGCDSCGTEFHQPGTCRHCGMTLIDRSKIMNVAIVVWDGVELLDFAGPGEVFASARHEDGRCFRVFTVSKDRQPIRSQGLISHGQNQMSGLPQPF